jgi:hypothetical protein
MWNSGVLSPGASYSVTFNTPGTFAYRCMIHPFMMGTVTVLGSASGPASAATPNQPSAVVVAPPAGLSISYATGWNLVAGPSGTTIAGTSGPLYTLRAGDPAYEAVPAMQPLAPGVGYWAYFPGPVTETLPLTVAAPPAIPLPAGQFVLVGNPTLRTPQGERELEQWDVAFFPDGEEGAHKVTNRTDANVRVALLSNKGDPGAAVYPDSNKVGVWPPGKLFRLSDAVDYWDGEAD